jgi:flagellar biosynthesis protein FlhB
MNSNAYNRSGQVAKSDDGLSLAKSKISLTILLAFLITIIKNSSLALIKGHTTQAHRDPQTDNNASKINPLLFQTQDQDAIMQCSSGECTKMARKGG